MFFPEPWIHETDRTAWIATWHEHPKLYFAHIPASSRTQTLKFRVLAQRLHQACFLQPWVWPWPSMLSWQSRSWDGNACMVGDMWWLSQTSGKNTVHESTGVRFHFCIQSSSPGSVHCWSGCTWVKCNSYDMEWIFSLLVLNVHQPQLCNTYVTHTSWSITTSLGINLRRARCTDLLIHTCICSFP